MKNCILKSNGNCHNYTTCCADVMGILFESHVGRHVVYKEITRLYSKIVSMALEHFISSKQYDFGIAIDKFCHMRSVFDLLVMSLYLVDKNRKGTRVPSRTGRSGECLSCQVSLGKCGEAARLRHSCFGILETTTSFNIQGRIETPLRPFTDKCHRHVARHVNSEGDYVPERYSKRGNYSPH